LKQRVQHVDHPLLNCPQQLVYFLLDEAGNVDAAEKWFHQAVQIRRERPHDMDTLCETFVLPDDFDYLPVVVMDGYDREGDPIHITRTGAADILGLYQRHGRENVIRHAIYYFEVLTRGAWIDDYEQRRGKKLGTYTFVFDLQGLSMRHVKPQLLPVLAYVSRLVQDTYPGLVKVG
jgi:CRAL/TRIO domain